MTQIIQPLLSPIRFHDPSLEFDNETTFQNPDNRLSTSYDWENINNVPYHLPIPKVWPDGQPGIDFMVILKKPGDVSGIKADLYDDNDEFYISCHIDLWDLIAGSPASEIYRIWLNGNDNTGVEDGFYTIKIISDDVDETVMMESEALLIADWFIDCIPFEFWNFENDFGINWDNGTQMFSSRIMAPIRLYDPIPEFEKEMYKDDPGVLTTLRTIPQRAFNFDSHPLPVHVIELIQLGFGCSTLYLDRIKINSEENPEAELYEGTNLKYLTGKATFVDFNDSYYRERVQTELDEVAGIGWNSSSYSGTTIVGNVAEVNMPDTGAGTKELKSDAITYDAGELIIIKIMMADDAGDSDLNKISFDSGISTENMKDWWMNTYAMKMSDAGSFVVNLKHIASYQKAVFSAKIEVYKIV